MPEEALVNKGLILTQPEGGAAGDGGRTFIVTGLQRSGTSLVAGLLRQVGIFMGEEINDDVNEDEAVARVLVNRDRVALKQLIADRNANYGTWGFKFPTLYEALRPDEVAMFANPHVIVPFRDPVAIAVRKSLSDYQKAMPGLRSVVEAFDAMVGFVERLQCPTLLLSYEKALIFPADFVDGLLRFCGLPRSNELRDRLIGLIEPNRPTYIKAARRRFDGVIDGIANGCLCGWCKLTGAAEPVALELWVDDQRVGNCRADLFRQDLLDAGLGTGRHAFSIDLRTLDLRLEGVVRVRVAEHGVELQNSGRTLRTYHRP